MELGVHLPLADFGDGTPSVGQLRDYVRTARDLGYAAVSANDHLVWRRPWLDGPTALAAVAGETGSMALATSIALPVVRHPAVVAKMLSSLASLTESRVIGGLGPGSSQADYDAVGVPFGERWARFDEAMSVVRTLVRGEEVTGGRFYGPVGPLAPVRDRAPEVWFGSWGSDRRLGALAAVADGWLASAYNATPEQYADARARLDGHVEAAGRDAATFPDAIATTWALITTSAGERERVLHDLLGPLLGRDPDTLGNLPIGSPAQCAEAVAAYAEAGAGMLLLWPLRDARAQLELLADATALARQE
jgi:alkanesulfonate monooxygenase SsuD/methylene tetrahydromethanopterin reductase-like flavin-dependent oxidoreductase (luciferase family)